MILFLGIILFVVIVRVAESNKNRKQIQKVKEDILQEVAKQLRSIREDMKDNPTKVKGTSVNKQSVLTIKDVENIVDTKIKDAFAISPVSQYSNIAKTDCSTVQPYIDKTNITPSLDTDNVIFDMEKVAFTIGETDIKIFRIYSKGGEFFYSIIDNPNIREEFVSMIASYSSCITLIDQGIQSTKRVEPQKDGKLIKNGDYYFVDPKNKLELRLV